jgi:hypothetical protein
VTAHPNTEARCDCVLTIEHIYLASNPSSLPFTMQIFSTPLQAVDPVTIAVLVLAAIATYWAVNGQRKEDPVCGKAFFVIL